MGRGERKFREAGLQKFNAQEGERVLEVGFGTGHCIVALAQSVGSSGQVYGLDISEGMCKITQSRVEETGLSDRVELKLGDAANLPFETNFLDAIFTSFTLELFDTPEIPVVLRQCQRVLKSNGHICVVAMSKEGKDSALMRLYEWAHERFPNYVDCRPIYVQRALADAGFKVLETTKTSYWGVLVEVVVAQKP
ncbi:MAG: methyltransferase domain-containing protein [Chloroflexota bacterium]|nr:methyltransferase domain-containing protein [Chloroflexota bacterium]